MTEDPDQLQEMGENSEKTIQEKIIRAYESPKLSKTLLGFAGKLLIETTIILLTVGLFIPIVAGALVFLGVIPFSYPISLLNLPTVAVPTPIGLPLVATVSTFAMVWCLTKDTKIEESAS